MKKILIITGGSKGIGKGIIEAYLAEETTVFSISRTVNADLSKKGVTQIELDLTETDDIVAELPKIFNSFEKDKVSKITLINNAGTLGKIGPVGKVDAKTIEQTIKLNATVPFISSFIFINYFQDWEVKKSIINITSGAALKPYFGWSMYCSSKAAVNMLTQTIALEQAEVNYPIKVFAIAPGVVDTDMQKEIRQSDKSDFKDIERFIALKEDGGLNDAGTVGKQIYQMDNDETLQSGSILRVAGN